MKTVKITRKRHLIEGMFGDLVIEDGWNCKTGELPWRDNQRNISCIPQGVYICKWIFSPKHGGCYELQNVPNRSNIQIHSANFCGDEELELRCELLGCIALGSDIGKLYGQLAVLNSRTITHTFNSHMGGLDFELTIKDAYN